jgi:hypothetical protein
MVNEKDIVTIDDSKYFVGQEHSNSRKGKNGIIRFYIPIDKYGDVDTMNGREVLTLSDEEYNAKLEKIINKGHLKTVSKSAIASAARLEKKFENAHKTPGESNVASHKVLRNNDLMKSIYSFLKGGRKTKNNRRKKRKTSKNANFR